MKSAQSSIEPSIPCRSLVLFFDSTVARTPLASVIIRQAVRGSVGVMLPCASAMSAICWSRMHLIFDVCCRFAHKVLRADQQHYLTRVIGDFAIPAQLKTHLTHHWINYWAIYYIYSHAAGNKCLKMLTCGHLH